MRDIRQMSIGTSLEHKRKKKWCKFIKFRSLIIIILFDGFDAYFFSEINITQNKMYIHYFTIHTTTWSQKKKITLFTYDGVKLNNIRTRAPGAFTTDRRKQIENHKPLSVISATTIIIISAYLYTNSRTVFPSTIIV